MSLVGSFTNYLPAVANGLSSLGFPSEFPLSFQFEPATELTHCTDYRNAALAFNVLITCLLFWVVRPKPIITFWSIFCIGFWHITLFSQPRDNPPPLDQAFGTFLPALFVAYYFWRVAWRFTLPAFRLAPIESSVWFLGPFWVGVLANLTTDKIPIDRLTAQDIRGRSGALTALIIIILVLVVIVVNQVRIIRKTGWLPHYLAWYVFGGLVVLVISQLPGLQLRIHHYIIAIVLMPGTAWPTRASAVYQGLLLGLFLNGVAAFGFDSILQTAADVSWFFSLLLNVILIISCMLVTERCTSRLGNPDVPHQLNNLQRLYPPGQPNDILEPPSRRERRMGRVLAPRGRRRAVHRSCDKLLVGCAQGGRTAFLQAGGEYSLTLL